MAFPIQLTLSTGNKVSLNYQTRDVAVSLTYQLEREDTDVLQVVKQKTQELAQAHRLAWQGLRDARVSAARGTLEELQTDGEPQNGNRKGSSPLASSPVHMPTDTLVEPVAPLEPATPGQRGALRVLLDQAGWKEEIIPAHLREQFGCETMDDLQAVLAAQWLLELQRAARVAAQHEKTSLNGARNGTGKQ